MILAAQVLLWFLSGFVMSLLPIEQVRGNHLKESAKTPINFTDVLSPSAVYSSSKVKSVEITMRGKIPVYTFKEGDSAKVFDARTGQELNFLTEEEITLLVKEQLKFKSEIKKIELRSKPHREFDAELPIWKIDFDSPETYSVYASPLTGQIRSVRNLRWRIFDFFWMLHIMDYVNRNNFNSPWLIGLSFLALILTVTGIMLIFAVPNRKKKKKSPNSSKAF